MARLRIKHQALEGGVIYLRRKRPSIIWRPTIAVWPDGKRQNAIKAMESVGLTINDYCAQTPQLVDRR